MRLDHISKANVENVDFGQTCSHPGFGLRSSRYSAKDRAACLMHASNDPKFSGGDIEEATPDPIPNSEVKLFGADGTAREAVWESRTLPGFI